jgi:predicted AlkP superfamily phosphohydrolase/phosphomutase
MDTIVGKALKHVDKDTVFFVLSDHGFKSFRRGINLNAWLLQNGYLALKDDAEEGVPYLKGVDWSRTRAYTFGLTGVYLNQEGREAQGVVAKSDAAALKREISDKLSGLRDDELDQLAIRQAWPKETIYNGPYMDVAPDIVIGYANGYRSSWDAALGKVTAEVFQDNLKAWSGDHCVDPALVPGVIFCNRKFESDDPGIEDLAPTTLGLFGQKPPAYMDGKDLFAAPKT